MNRRIFLKFVSTATAAAALPAIGAAPALGVEMPGLYSNMHFERPISAPRGSRFVGCSFSAEATANLPRSCEYFFCYFDGPIVIHHPSNICAREQRLALSKWEPGVSWVESP